MTDSQLHSVPFWRRRFQFTPFRAFVIGGVLGAITGAAMAALVDHRDLDTIVWFAVLFAVFGSFVSATFQYLFSDPEHPKTLFRLCGLCMLAICVLMVHLGWFPILAQDPLFFLLLFGGVSGLVWFTVGGFCCLVTSLTNRAPVLPQIESEF
jgi:hypothetical protein